ncbi:AraC family transcriptional regulator [Flavobacterium rakeshii]|uniref:AraC family transcriptional regulator n=1 Tax=Flavobacterium rakeshii TaxID=1038845 RepID=A0A6N8HD56_9FLAO|nr:GyrI-like domain-containing protein [Flavobacterium rakeshii]MUV03256.1 AraC family transcriptional regulator [Flavobacterium rakeshii]
MEIKNTSFKLAGLKLGFKTTNENNKAMEDCGALWQHFGGSFIGNKLPQKLSNDVYAVYFDYEGDHTNPYAYFIGYRIPEDAEIPSGVDTITIPSQHYETVTAKGQMPNCVADTWREIWKKDDSDRAYGFDFEVYGAKAADWNNAEIDIYLSVK